MTTLLNSLNPKQINIMKKFFISFALVAFIIGACVLTSCNVTRTISNESQYFQRGDTSVVIQTRTVETYDASKKL